MKKIKKGQAGIEYLIIVGFVTITVIAILGLSYYYSNLTKDRIKINQVESFANQLINSAESVFFAGEPSETEVRLYLPGGIQSIDIDDDFIVINISTSTGYDVLAFKSRVPLQGTIPTTESLKIISLKARENYVEVGVG